jgi:hypothetical protein
MLSRGARTTFGRLRDLDLLARMLLLVFASHSIVVASATWRPAWDELNYLHRAVCVDRTLLAGDWAGTHECMLLLFKSPVLMLLLLPVGQIGDNVDLIRMAPVMLAVFNFCAVLGIALLTWRLRVPLAVVLVAAIAIASNPLTHVVAGALLIDTFLGFVVTIAVLLFAFEASSNATSWRSAALRGALWGLVGTVGVLSKITFGYFVVLLFMPMVGIVWYREGFRPALIRVIGCAVVSIPGLIIFALYANQYFAHALKSSVGSFAELYSDHLTLKAFIALQLTGTGFGGVILLVMAAAAIVTTVRRRVLDWTALYLLLVLLGYLWVSANTVSRDARYLLPFWLALPWCLAFVLRAPDGSGPQGAPVRDFALAGLVGVFLALPSIKNYDLSGVELSINALRTIPTDRPVRVLTATDTGDFNIESVLLAYQLDRRRFPAGLLIDTLVYDGVNGRTLDQSMARLRSADIILFRYPLDPKTAALWSNEHHEAFLRVAQAEGRELAVIGPDPSVHVFVMPRQPR